MILVDAVYTNHSGSKRLLEYFIDSLIKRNILDSYYFLFDGRLTSNAIKLVRNDRYQVLSPGESSRRAYYRHFPGDIETVFCFGSVPPPVSIKKARVIVLQHNPFFFENPGYGFRHKFVYWLKRTYIRFQTLPAYQWVVQTPRMKDMLMDHLGVQSEQIHLLPFYEAQAFQRSANAGDKDLAFIYPADGVPQKNHKFLFDIWETLAGKYHRTPELHVTLPEKYPHHLERIKNLQSQGVRIINHGFVSKQQMGELYAQCSHMIFPSMSESFGLPLVEAAMSGLKVIGSDLPFIYQVIEPSAVFDPRNHESLLKLILAMCDRKVDLPETKVVISNRIEDLLNLIHSANKVTSA